MMSMIMTENNDDDYDAATYVGDMTDDDEY